MPVPRPSYRWLLLIEALAILFLWGSFSTEIGDTDFWWHLRTGQYIVETHSLPAPDPFSYTSSLGAPAYPGEEQVRNFNLTHEWLSQAAWFVLYKIGGFPLLVLWKGLLLAGLCVITGYLAMLRSGNFLLGIAAALVPLPVVQLFAADRPALLTFFLVAVFIMLLERFRLGSQGRAIWILVPLQWAWANAHGGFFFGWIVLGAFVAESFRLPEKDRRTLWMVSAACVLVALLNPNGVRVFEVLANYRRSYLTSMLIEWKSPPLWGPPYTFDILLYLAAAAMLLNFKRLRISDGLLMLAFSAAALLAFRNVIFVAFFAPVMIAAYGWPLLASRLPRIPSTVVAGGFLAALAALLANGLLRGDLFQLRAAEWKFPVNASQFLKDNQVTARMFNSYEHGGYLIWSAWPQQQSFIDGRALNESVYRDYQKILYSAGTSAEQSRQQREQLLQQYGADIVVMNGFEYVTGVIYPIVLALADPKNETWQLVFQDSQAVVFARDTEKTHELIARHRLEKSGVLEHLETSCRTYMEHDPELPNCARRLGFLFLQAKDRTRARAALSLYLEKIPYRDEEAERAFRAASAGQ